MNLRLVSPADIPWMMNLERSCPGAAHWAEARYQELFQTTANGVERFVIVAEKEKSPDDDQSRAEAMPDSRLGFLVARYLAPEWELENIVVAPSARHQGIGQQLIDAWLKHIRETNSAEVFLEVRESNAAARSLYEKNGFQQTGRRKGYYSDPIEDAILYRKSLN